MNIVRRVFYFFSKYTDPAERSVGIFFNQLTEHNDTAKTRRQLHELMQRDIAVINLWTEYRYKGYKYLTKSHRKTLYTNLGLIAQDFADYHHTHQQDIAKIINQIQPLNRDAKVDKERIMLLQAIMEYLSPQSSRYEYRASSSFGRLLRNPKAEKLIGDCNQIVTLYIYLYSRYFDIRDLKVRLLPEHIALHYGGVDIEATNGTFTNYNDQADSRLMPIEEIVSVNLLDTTDAYLETHEIAAEDFLQASRFAFILSHYRDIVKHNLEAAYSKLINLLMGRHNYTQALKFAKASRDITLLSVVGTNGAAHSMQNHHYAAARRYAAYSVKKDELIKASYHNEGVHHYQHRRYHDAISAFKKTSDTSLIKSCYEALFFEEQKKLDSNLTTATIKSHKNTIKHMQTYAKKSQNHQLIDAANSLIKYL